MNYQAKQALFFFMVVLAYYTVLETVLFHDDLSTSTSAKSQIDFDLATPQLIPIENRCKLYYLNIPQRIP